MALFTVDEEKCGFCGTCIVVCPAGLIQMSDADAVPTSANGDDDACRDCGHCVVVCPNEAFSHGKVDSEQCIPIRDELRIESGQIGQLMRSRRSVRNYEDKPVARETILELLDIARYAPSGCNTQPVHWLVVYETDRVRQISEMVIEGLRHQLRQESKQPLSDVLVRLVKTWDDGSKDVVSRGAPHLIIAHGPKDDPGSPSAGIIAQTYLELAASVFGLGTCWIGLVDMTADAWPPLKQFLGLPQGHVVLGTMAIGYPQFKYARIPLRKELRVTWR